MQKKQSGLCGWIRTIADIVVIVLIVLAAKTAIAETVLRSLQLYGTDIADRR